MAAAVVGLSASAATVYWDNEGSNWSDVYAYSWQPDVLQKLEATNVDGHSLYAITLDNAMVIFRANNSSWGDAVQTCDLKVVDGAVYGKQSIKSLGGNDAAVANIVDGKYVAEAAPVPDTYPALYVRGTVNGWGTGSDWKLATADGVTYTFAGSIAAGAEFKIASSTWEQEGGMVWAGMDALTINKGSYTLTNSSATKNMKAGEEITEISLNVQTGVMVVNGGNGDNPNPPVIEPENYTYRLHGSIVNGEWQDIMLENNDGNWTWTGTLIPGEFGIKKMDGNNQVAWISSADGTVITAAGTYNCKQDGTNFASSLEGNYTVTYNPTANTISFEAFAGPIQEVVTYAIHGQIGGDENWATYDMTEKDGVWVLTMDCVEGGFGIRKNVNGSQVDWFQAQDGEGTIAENGTWTCTGIGGENFNLTKAGEVTFSFNAETQELTVEFDNNVAVNTVAAAEGDAVYFNMQGVKVANPERGIFIKVAGGKATKVVK